MRKRGNSMTVFVKADETAMLLNCSKNTAYKIIAKLNDELETKGFLTIRGRISKDYLYERMGIKEHHEEKEVV